MDVNDFSRIDKLFVDRNGVSPEQSHAQRSECRIEVFCGDEVMTSATTRAAALTFLELAKRCFPGAVCLRTASEPVRVLLGVAATQRVSPPTVATAVRYVVAFGTTDTEPGALQVSFDGWTAQVAPVSSGRLRENDYCPLAGVLAGALAMSEIFLHFASMEMVATHRRVMLSLWQPAARVPEPGPPLKYLPSRAWLVGLGHLGQAYAWAFSVLPFPRGAIRELWLVDDERVIKANTETGILNTTGHIGHFKTRVASNWLQLRSVKTRLIERRIDATFQVTGKEPRLILGGLDDNRARQWLAQSGGTQIDCGIGNRADNFDTIVLHTWPNERAAADLWPVPVDDGFADRLIQNNKAYAQLANDECGRVRLAERSVGVPYVGAVAACFAWANVLRDLHEGPHVLDLKLRLATPQEGDLNARTFSSRKLASIDYVARDSG